MKLFHGSPTQLQIGLTLKGRGSDYDADWSVSDFYQALKFHRPAGSLSHSQAVFAVGSIDDIDLAGGSLDFVYEGEAVGPVSRHDLNWSSEVSCLIGDGHAIDSVAVAEAAANYWSGIPHTNEQVWEYLCEALTIVRDIDERLEPVTELRAVAP